MRFNRDRGAGKTAQNEPVRKIAAKRGRPKQDSIRVKPLTRIEQ
jgi:hypothetical protein